MGELHRIVLLVPTSLFVLQPAFAFGDEIEVKKKALNVVLDLGLSSLLHEFGYSREDR